VYGLYGRRPLATSPRTRFFEPSKKNRSTIVFSVNSDTWKRNAFRRVAPLKNYRSFMPPRDDQPPRARPYIRTRRNVYAEFIKNSPFRFWIHSALTTENDELRNLAASLSSRQPRSGLRRSLRTVFRPTTVHPKRSVLLVFYRKRAYVIIVRARSFQRNTTRP